MNARCRNERSPVPTDPRDAGQSCFYRNSLRSPPTSSISCRASARPCTRRPLSARDTLADQRTIHNAFPERGHTLKLDDHHDTDSLYIDLSEQVSAERREVSAGIVLDYEAAGNLVGIDIDNASRKVALQRLIVSRLPGEGERIAG